jgi:mRNA interferase RelE/StbE
MPSSIILRPQAKRFLDKLRDPDLYTRLRAAIDRLAHDPRPPRCLKLSGQESLHRVRVGDYRIIYQIRDSELLIVIVDIGHRRDIYR